MASKQELIDYVADRTELSKVNAAKAINAFVEAITYYISEGTPVHISNFGLLKFVNVQPESVMMFIQEKKF